MQTLTQDLLLPQWIGEASVDGLTYIIGSFNGNGHNHDNILQKKEQLWRIPSEQNPCGNMADKRAAI